MSDEENTPEEEAPKEEEGPNQREVIFNVAASRVPMFASLMQASKIDFSPENTLALGMLFIALSKLFKVPKERLLKVLESLYDNIDPTGLFSLEVPEEKSLIIH